MEGLQNLKRFTGKCLLPLWNFGYPGPKLLFSFSSIETAGISGSASSGSPPCYLVVLSVAGQCPLLEGRHLQHSSKATPTPHPQPHPPSPVLLTTSLSVGNLPLLKKKKKICWVLFVFACIYSDHSIYECACLHSHLYLLCFCPGKCVLLSLPESNALSHTNLLKSPILKANKTKTKKLYSAHPLLHSSLWLHGSWKDSLHSLCFLLASLSHWKAAPVSTL